MSENLTANRCVRGDNSKARQSWNRVQVALLYCLICVPWRIGCIQQAKQTHQTTSDVKGIWYSHQTMYSFLRKKPGASLLKMATVSGAEQNLGEALHILWMERSNSCDLECSWLLTDLLSQEIVLIRVNQWVVRQQRYFSHEVKKVQKVRHSVLWSFTQVCFCAKKHVLNVLCLLHGICTLHKLAGYVSCPRSREFLREELETRASEI